MHSNHTRRLFEWAQSEAVSEEENKEVLGSLDNTSCFMEISRNYGFREMQKTPSLALLCVMVCGAISGQTHSVVPFSGGNVTPHLLSFGKIS